MSMKDSSLWTWHMAAGLVVLVLLGLHMAMMHLNGILPMGAFNPASEDPLDWGNVVYRSGQVLQLASYVLLLGFGLFHGFYGLRNILLELDPPTGLARVIKIALVVIGFGMFAFGAWSAVAARTTALALATTTPA